MQLITPAMTFQLLEIILVLFLIFAFIAILGSLWRKLLGFLLSGKKKVQKNKGPQKTHEKQLKKLDKVYGTYSIAKVDKMSGQEFELFVEKLFRVLEKDHIVKTEFTPTTGDHGCDLIIHYKDGHKLGIQCKRYKNKVDNHAVQQIVTSKAIYGLSLMMVFSNNGYMPGAKIAADSNRVELVDRAKLSKMIDRYNETIKALHTKK